MPLLLNLLLLLGGVAQWVVSDSSDDITTRYSSERIPIVKQLKLLLCNLISNVTDNQQLQQQQDNDKKRSPAKSSYYYTQQLRIKESKSSLYSSHEQVAVVNNTTLSQLLQPPSNTQNNEQKRRYNLLQLIIQLQNPERWLQDDEATTETQQRQQDKNDNDQITAVATSWSDSNKKNIAKTRYQKAKLLLWFTITFIVGIILVENIIIICLWCYCFAIDYRQRQSRHLIALNNLLSLNFQTTMIVYLFCYQ